MIENFVWNFLFYFKILQFAEKGENYKKRLHAIIAQYVFGLFLRFK